MYWLAILFISVVAGMLGFLTGSYARLEREYKELLNWRTNLNSQLNKCANDGRDEINDIKKRLDSLEFKGDVEKYRKMYTDRE